MFLLNIFSFVQSTGNVWIVIKKKLTFRFIDQFDEIEVSYEFAQGCKLMQIEFCKRIWMSQRLM